MQYDAVLHLLPPNWTLSNDACAASANDTR